jgi:hypothetical protein
MRPLTPAQAGFPPASRDFSLCENDARRRAETPCRTRFVVPTLATVMRPGVLRAYPKNCNLFACGVIAVRAAGLFG